MHPKYTWSRKDVGSPKSTSLLSTLPHRINIVFLSSQFLCHPHTQIRLILFHDEQRDIPYVDFSPNRVSIGFSQIAFPIIVLPKDDRTDSTQEERLDLPHWAMIWAICVVVDESRCLDTPIFGIFNNLWASSIFTWGFSRYCVCCLSIATRAIWRWYPWF